MLLLCQPVATGNPAGSLAPDVREDEWDTRKDSWSLHDLPVAGMQVNQLLVYISPTKDSEAQRDNVVKFVQDLVERCFGQYGKVGAAIATIHSAARAKPVPSSSCDCIEAFPLRRVH